MSVNMCESKTREVEVVKSTEVTRMCAAEAERRIKRR
jgi:hypothetical protein